MEESDYTIKEFIEDNLKIKNKEGKLINLNFNNAQGKLYEVIKENYGKKPVRIIVLKARQLGISTFTEGLITALTINTPNTDAVLIAHNTESAGKIYEMTQLFIDCLPPGLKPKQKYSNKKQIVFDGAQGVRENRHLLGVFHYVFFFRAAHQRPAFDIAHS